jgi:hypothetical protein
LKFTFSQHYLTHDWQNKCETFQFNAGLFSLKAFKKREEVKNSEVLNIFHTITAITVTLDKNCFPLSLARNLKLPVL